MSINFRPRIFFVHSWLDYVSKSLDEGCQAFLIQRIKLLTVLCVACLSHSSLSIPRAKDETLSRHSINGYSGQTIRRSPVRPPKVYRIALCIDQTKNPMKSLSTRNILLFCSFYWLLLTSFEINAHCRSSIRTPLRLHQLNFQGLATSQPLSYLCTFYIEGDMDDFDWCLVLSGELNSHRNWCILVHFYFLTRITIISSEGQSSFSICLWW
jgi:hypothetical protein